MLDLRGTFKRQVKFNSRVKFGEVYIQGEVAKDGRRYISME